jgi:uncharacterized protein YbaR (Trm112 family)
MFIELIDTLRCPQAHADSWLVASSLRTVGRHIVDGALGCPECKATYAIRDAVVCFADTDRRTVASDVTDDDVFRLAAQLHLVEAPGAIVLTGAWGAYAAPLVRTLPTLQLFAVNASVPLPLDERISALSVAQGVLPLAASSVRGVALDAHHAGAAMLDAASRVVRTGGRLVVPAHCTPAAAEWRELARDASAAVFERLTTASAPVTLKRAPARPLFQA